MTDIVAELDATARALSRAHDYGLECEVVCYALKAMKEDSKISLADALEIGCAEWDV